jgi:hypothetical protein
MPIPNHYKYCTTKQVGCLISNNVCIAVDNSYEYGPTSTTGFWNGYTPIDGTSYTIIEVKPDNSSISIIETNSVFATPPFFLDNSAYWFQIFTPFSGDQDAGQYLITGGSPNVIITSPTNTWRDFGSTITSGLTLCSSVKYFSCLPLAVKFRKLYDISGNNFVLDFTNGVIFTRAFGQGLLFDGTDDNMTLPGSSTIYTSNFTWQVMARYIAGTTDKYAFMWAETGATKNFGISYSDLNTSGTSMVIETATATYSSTTVGTNYNGFSGQNGVQSSIRANLFVLTTIVKEGNEFRVYWDNAILKWIVNIPTWTTNNSIPISFAAKNDLTLESSIVIGELRFYNRVLSTNEISINYSGMTQMGYV